MDKFNEAKQYSRIAQASLSKCLTVAAYNRELMIARMKEAETFRDMVKDNGYVHTIPLDDLKFSWEE